MNVDIEGNEDIDTGTLMKKIVGAGQKLAHNYLDNFSGYLHDNRDILLTYFNFVSKVMVSPKEQLRVYSHSLDFFHHQQKLWRYALSDLDGKHKADGESKDRRFYGDDWNAHPYYFFLKEQHLLLERFAQQLITEVEMSGKTQRKLQFYTNQYLDAFSPSNFIWSNPEVLRLCATSGGKNLYDGFNNLLNDIIKGRITQTDEKAFEVGVNLACTPGMVVYENELMQVIRYTPVTPKVYGTPLLLIPPWINKYYIMDLQKSNSLVRFLIENEIEVFVISWVNPRSDMGYITFDDYVNKGALQAIDVAKSFSSTQKVNALGYCLGGTLLSIAASLSALDNENDPLNTVTFLASMIDFTDIGPMGDVIDKALVKKLKREELSHNGVLLGHDMERAFNLIRANDLIWRYVVDNYLKGKLPTPFDVMYWTNDNTNLPRQMYLFYMRNMILSNKLSRKNALHINKKPVDIGRIKCPVFVAAMDEDYISPAKTCFTTTELVSGPVEFILGGSGHVIGAINPPSKKKYGYFKNGKLGNGFKSWKNTAEHFEGSWWTPWSLWLIEHSGEKTNASADSDNKEYPPIEPAPGRYVKERSL